MSVLWRQNTDKLKLTGKVRKAGRGYLEQGSIRQQLYKAYILVGLIPITIIGIFLLVNTYTMFKKYNQDLLESYNQRVSTTFFEITTQTYILQENFRMIPSCGEFCPEIIKRKTQNMPQLIISV